MRFHQHLVAELSRRCDKNPRYSLRSFARQLRVDHSTLSQLVRGKRPMTDATIRRLGARLGLDAAALDAFVAREPDAEARQRDETSARDAARVFSEPHHAAILELTRHPDFRPDARWIARVLGLTTDAVELAVSRLTHLGLLQLAGTTWTDTSRGDLAAAVRRASQALHPKEQIMDTTKSTLAGTGRPVTQWQILAKDPDRAARFYGAVFGWSVDAHNALGYRQIDTHSERGIGGGIWPAPPEARPAVQLFVEVDDFEPHLARAKAQGGNVAIPPQQLPDGDSMAIIIDPEGLPVGLFKRRA